MSDLEALLYVRYVLSRWNSWLWIDRTKSLVCPRYATESKASGTSDVDTRDRQTHSAGERPKGFPRDVIGVSYGNLEKRRTLCQGNNSATATVINNDPLADTKFGKGSELGEYFSV